jgi:hypothetical protein
MTREELLKIAKPILFNTDMVKAILDGRKTVTRRVLKHPFEIHPNGYITKPRGNERLCPYEPPYQPGDILYVRETWNVWTGGYIYKAWSKPFPQAGCYPETKWHPSIHMPKEAARIFLKVKDVRVEQLQDITPDDAVKEGTKETFPPLAADEFRDIWNSTIKKSDFGKYGWGANPWVWVIEFSKMEAEQ